MKLTIIGRNSEGKQVTKITCRQAFPLFPNGSGVDYSKISLDKKMVTF